MAQPLDKPLSASPVPVEHRRHYRLFKHVVPPWLVETTTERRSALRQTQAQVPEWFGGLTLKEKDALKAMIDVRGQSLNTLEKALGGYSGAARLCPAVVDASIDKRWLQRAD